MYTYGIFVNTVEIKWTELWEAQPGPVYLAS